MLTNEEFATKSIDLNLFFMRIMKEHMFFIEVAFTPKDKGLSNQSNTLKMEATRVLADTISISDGLVSPQVAGSGELVTDYTIPAEQATQYFTGIPFDTTLTESERGLAGGNRVLTTPTMLQRISNLNQRAINLVKSIIVFKEKLLKDVLSCKIFTLNYPLLIDHILREAKFYLDMLNKLQNRDAIDSRKDLMNQEVFWNRIMAEHSKFIRGLLDPTEIDLFDKANMFGLIFDELTEEAQKTQSKIELIPKVTENSLEATGAIRSFKRQGTEGILECKIKSIIIPLLGDHTLREANHFFRILKNA